MIAIQLGSDATAVQAQAGPTETVKLPIPPVAGTLPELGLNEYAQGGGGGGETPVWFTVKVWPAMVAVTTLPSGVEIEGMVTVTGPLRAPEGGATPNVALDAVHGHPSRDAMTFTVAVPPAAVALTLVGLIANEQVEPNCVTWYVWPATVMLPVRAGWPGGFAATL